MEEMQGFPLPEHKRNERSQRKAPIGKGKQEITSVFACMEPKDVRPSFNSPASSLCPALHQRKGAVRERKKERCRIMECVLYINNTPLFVPLFSGSDQCSCTARNAKNDSLPSSLLFLCVLACVVHKRGSPTPLPIACQYHKSYLSQHSKYIYFL